MNDKTESLSVLVLEGVSGTGKTTLAEKWFTKSGGRMQLLKGPSNVGDALVKPEWGVTDCIGIDEISQYEHSSAKSVINDLIADAQCSDKTVLLIVQHRTELTALGIEVPVAHAVCKTSWGEFGFKVKGRKLRFA